RERPRDTRHVVLAGDTEPGAELQLQLRLPGEQTSKTVAITAGARVPTQSSDADPVLVEQPSEAGEPAGRGGLEPAPERFGRLARPLRTVCLGKLAGFLEPVESLIDELPLQLPDDRLRVGVTDVEMAVMEDQDLLDPRRRRP